MLGSIDSNTGSPDMGWDTDQFPMDIRATTAVMQVGIIYLHVHFEFMSISFLKFIEFSDIYYIIIIIIYYIIFVDSH